MKGNGVFVFVLCCAFAALLLCNGEKPATVSHAKRFDASTTPKTTATTPKTTTTTPKTTTTTPKTTTTTPKTTTTTPKTTPTTPKTTTTTPKTTITSPKTTPTTPKTTTTTPKTTTTTPKTTTTTPKTTTTTPKTTTTTPKTTTTTPKTTTPAPGPTPSTNLTVGNYTVKANNVVCLKAQMAVQIRVAKPEVNGTFTVQPAITSSDGTCEETKANLKLSFKEGFINFMFNKSSAENAGYVSALSFQLNYAFVKGQMKTYSVTNSTVHLFTAKVGHSYSCRVESLNMGNGLYLDIKQDRLQAFGLPDSKEFGIPDPCVADQPHYGVAIAVGVTLLILIIIVIVAYILTHRRRTSGYQSL